MAAIEFWRVWLDESLSYSCAYFQSADDSLAAAQTAKLDYICRKLRLRPGMRRCRVEVENFFAWREPAGFDRVSSIGAAGFEIRDVESLREHYALTLRHWLQRFEAAQDELQK